MPDTALPTLPQLRDEAFHEANAGVACKCGRRFTDQGPWVYTLLERTVNPETFEPMLVTATVLSCGRADCPVDQRMHTLAVARQQGPAVQYLRARIDPDGQTSGPLWTPHAP